MALASLAQERLQLPCGRRSRRRDRFSCAGRLVYDNRWLILRIIGLVNGSLPQNPASISNDCLFHRVQRLATVEHPGPSPILPTIPFEGIYFRQCDPYCGCAAAVRVLLAGWALCGLDGRVVKSNRPTRMSHCGRI